MKSQHKLMALMALISAFSAVDAVIKITELNPRAIEALKWKDLSDEDKLTIVKAAIGAGLQHKRLAARSVLKAGGADLGALDTVRAELEQKLRGISDQAVKEDVVNNVLDATLSPDEQTRDVAGETLDRLEEEGTIDDKEDLIDIVNESEAGTVLQDEPQEQAGGALEEEIAQVDDLLKNLENLDDTTAAAGPSQQGGQTAGQGQSGAASESSFGSNGGPFGDGGLSQQGDQTAGQEQLGGEWEGLFGLFGNAPSGQGDQTTGNGQSGATSESSFDPFAVLGLRATADREAVRRAFVRQAKGLQASDQRYKDLQRAMREALNQLPD